MSGVMTRRVPPPFRYSRGLSTTRFTKMPAHMLEHPTNRKQRRARSKIARKARVQQPIN
jgi:hypothetical protein